MPDQRRRFREQSRRRNREPKVNALPIDRRGEGEHVLLPGSRGTVLTRNADDSVTIRFEGIGDVRVMPSDPTAAGETCTARDAVIPLDGIPSDSAPSPSRDAIANTLNARLRSWGARVDDADRARLARALADAALAALPPDAGGDGSGRD